ncbi:hypothetical protein J2Y47_002948 [Arcicella sp. BE51]|nr:hypothetical protein [Arcicella sp. BE51]
MDMSYKNNPPTFIVNKVKVGVLFLNYFLNICINTSSNLEAILTLIL